jgi:hypothetical protein
MTSSVLFMERSNQVCTPSSRMSARHNRSAGPVINRSRLLLPVWPDINTAATALAALHAQAERWDLDFVGVVIDVDDGPVQEAWLR